MEKANEPEDPQRGGATWGARRRGSDADSDATNDSFGRWSHRRVC